MTDLICLFSFGSKDKVPTNLVDFLLSIEGSMTYLTLIVILLLND